MDAVLAFCNRGNLNRKTPLRGSIPPINQEALQVNNASASSPHDRELLWQAAQFLAERAYEQRIDDTVPFDFGMFADRFVGVIDFIDGALSNQTTHVMRSVNRNGILRYDLTRFAERHVRRLHYYIGVIEQLPNEYDYTPHINLFRSCWESLEIRLDYPSLGHCSHAFLKLGPSDPDARIYEEIFNNLVDKVRTLAKATRFSSILAERRRQAADRFRDYCKYVDSLHDAVANLIVIRVDLNYKTAHAHTVGFTQAKRDIAHFFANRRNNGIFEGLVGQIVKIEYGIAKGFHFHFLLFFDGSKRNPRGHSYFAKVLGEYWRDVITQGRGEYWNVNGKIREYRKKGICGIGPIHASDTDLRHNLKERVVGYLCKLDQFIRPRLSQRVKLITRGNHRPPARQRRPRRGVRN